MKNSKEVLSSILKTSQMGQIGIRSVQNAAQKDQMKQALDQQLQRYCTIEKEAHQIADSRGWRLEELRPTAKMMASISARMRLQGQNKDSKIAALLVTGNTKGMIKGLKNAHRYHGRDARIQELSNKLLAYENENIRLMEPFI